MALSAAYTVAFAASNGQIIQFSTPRLSFKPHLLRFLISYDIISPLTACFKNVPKAKIGSKAVWVVLSFMVLEHCVTASETSPTIGPHDNRLFARNTLGRTPKLGVSDSQPSGCKYLHNS
eukprot:2737133-Amphidinium_carterae.1